jgi:ketosteroid isomerase-like protein
MTRDEAWTLAQHWVAAWNAHDLDRIMSHYEEAMELGSGPMVGHAQLRL